jgi:exopolysaccharide biosynthesis polyprenyl glycosylphosphotransferase
VDIAALLLAAVIARLSFDLTLAFVTFGILAVWSTGLHPGRLAPRISDEIPDLSRNIAVAMVGFGLVGGSGSEVGEIVRLGLLAFALTLLARAILYDALHRLRVRGYALEPVVMVGAGPTAVNLAIAMDEHPECGLVPVGFVDHNAAFVSPLPYLGRVADLSHIMSDVGARHAMFAFGAVRESEMVSTIRRCDPRSHFYVLSRFFELGVDGGSPSVSADIAGFPVRRIRPSALGHPMRRLKRLIDLAVALVGLIVLTPVMVLCAAAVRLNGSGPILFRQTRVGRNGATFEILKFRTMEVNTDSDITWSVESDRRVTTVGRILRASHLDELPQLLNVLRGEMSLVGPRPERPFFVRQFGEQFDGYGERHRVRAGITGWSQVNGLVGDSSIEERARYDNWYIEHWSWWADMLILLRTIPTMARRRR